MMQKVMNVSLMSRFNLSGQTRPNLEPKIGVKPTAVYIDHDWQMTPIDFQVT
ncbi:hypothetical protein DPMN_091885, partial [Dreissena polymorpha]